uniref:ATP-dependent DNA helicase n=1 Tax=Pygocentrus nattereri TaxID=42514 RepID=A0AAR2L016_PYGNA
MFDHRFHCFLKDVIMSEAQPIGKIVDYFYRVEFQQRGSPHTHCLFWVENAPQIDKDEDHEVVAFVDHYVTCEMPPEDDKEMHEIVLSVQRHSKRHSKTCKKKGTTCRFNFPRPPSNRTFITRCTTDDAKKDSDGSCDKENNSSNIISPRIEKDLAEAIVKKVKEALMNTEVSFDSVDALFASLGINQEIFEAAYLRMTRKTSVVLKRAPCDVWVNQYNRDLLHNPHCMPKQQAMTLIRALNEKQSEIFYKIRQWCLQKTRGENPEPFQVFISGPGGVGKSMLIKALHYEAYRILSHLSDNPDEIHVLLTAPTGVSAYNIDAATIHTCLSIGKDIKLPYQPLGDDKINSLRSKLGNLQILIIDEISMVDHKLLAYVHGRLRQIKQTGDYSPFGKVSIIAVGDFYQLGPVKGKPLYTEPTGVNLWQNHFALAELTDIMRQKDAEFAQLLNRLRKRKKGEVLPEQDINMLKQCETGEGADSTDLHIYATNEEVDDHNRRMLHRMCSDTTVIHAQDFERIAKTVHNTCLTQALHIGVNARVMLLKNIDVSDGLVNGAFGTVNEVSKHPGLKPGLTKATSIQPEEERVTNNGGIRRQFPLKLAWACTIHKVQGLTVEKAVVSLKKIFAAGQAYVALSRVTSLKGLIIQDFKESAIYSKADIDTLMQSISLFTY